MKRKKLADIKTKEDRQEYLTYMLNKKLKEVRKVVYRYSKRDLFLHPVEIEETVFNKLTTAGQYKWIKEKQTHKIQIATRVLDNMLRQDYDPESLKVFDKMQFQNTLLHEIVHGLVQEKFEFIYSDIKNKNTDGSPVFLATLQFLGGESSHDCAVNYFLTKTWRDVQDMITSNKKWDDFMNYIFFYLDDIEKIKRDYNKENYLKGKSIDFEFSYYGSGLHKSILMKTSMIAYIQNKRIIKTIETTNTTFEIGSMMDSKTILKLLPKKLSNTERADTQVISINKMLANEITKYTKFVYQKEYKYSKWLEEKKIADSKKSTENEN